MTQIHLPHDHGESFTEPFDFLLEHVDFQTVSQVFKQLSDSSRLQIFWLLCHCEECVVNISALVEQSSPAVSHHLRILKDSGLIVSMREGKEVYYKAADTETVRQLHGIIEKIVAIHCPSEEIRQKLDLSDQMAVVQRIHKRITEDLKHRFTIEELAADFLMNPTTLKVAFKKRYGLPIASYMKKYKMEAAAKMLQENSGMAIAEVAREVGYESQGKFAAAFKEIMGTGPREFRKKG